MSEQPLDAPEYETMNLLNYGSEPDLVAAAVTHAQAALPQWTPRAGNTEVVLMEALAIILGVEVMAIQMLPAQVLEQLMTLYGVTRDPGRSATGRVRFTVTNAAPIQTIPTGTRLRFSLDSTSETIDILTLEPLQLITTEQTSGVVSVSTELPGINANGLPVGMPLDVVDNYPFIEMAVVEESLERGTGIETDSAFYSRAASVLSRLTSTLVLPEHFQYMAVSHAHIGRARVLDLFNPAAPGVVSPGHVTIALTDPNGEPLTAEEVAEMAGAMKAQCLASLTLHLIDPTYTELDLNVTVKASYGFTSQQVQDSVLATLSSWLHPMAWDWEPQVSQYAIVSRVASAAGVAEVQSAPMTKPLAGNAPLPRLGKVTVTVNMP